MSHALRTILSLLMFCPLVRCHAQDNTEPHKADDLRKLLIDAGFDEKSNLNWSLEPYVRFGSKKMADKHARGDQFDRLEVKKAAEPHRADLREKRLLLDGLKLRVAEREDVETKGLVTEIDLPMRVRGEEPFYKDALSFSGSLSMMHPYELDVNAYWFLTKEKAIRQCTPAEAVFVKQNKGILYQTERANTSLVLIFKDKLEVLKDIGRNHRDYSVEVEFTELSWERPLSWGCFRSVALVDADWDCQKLWLKHMSDIIDGIDDKQPVYFATEFGKEDEAKTPEIVKARLTSLRVVDKSGKTVGGYKLPIDEAVPKRVSVLSPQPPVPPPATPSKDTFAGQSAGEGKELAAGFQFHWCPPGSFEMGYEDSPVQVTLSGFWLAETEATQGQWMSLMKSAPWKGQKYVQEGPNYAASYIGHGDAGEGELEADSASEFCRRLTEQERKAGRLPAGWKYALPTAAQWEYACRAGTKSTFSFGDDETNLSEYGWWGGSPLDDGNAKTEQYAHQVGLKKENSWGFRDMHGNVCEWTADWYAEKLPAGSNPPGGSNPRGPSTGFGRVYRGGSWSGTAFYCRSAHRDRGSTRGNAGAQVGFRVSAVPSSE